LVEEGFGEVVFYLKEERGGPVAVGD